MNMYANRAKISVIDSLVNAAVFFIFFLNQTLKKKNSQFKWLQSILATLK